jgi:hypothetical protein
MSAPESPTRVKRNATLLRAVPNRRSLAIARIAPAPTHTPSTAATTGCGQARIAFTRSPVICVNSRSPSRFPARFISTRRPMISCTSPPLQKFPPAPVSTTARTSLTVWRRRKVSVSSRYDSSVSGFFRSGRSRVIVATRSAYSQRKCFGLMLEAAACGAFTGPRPRLPAARSP